MQNQVHTHFAVKYPRFPYDENNSVLVCYLEYLHFYFSSNFLLGTATLVLIMILAVVGMDWVTRVQMGLLVLLIVSQFDFIIGSFMPKENEKKFGFTGYSTETFKKNLYSDYHDNINPDNPKEINFFTLFGVFFPAVTGIVAGANLSGDLKDPGVGKFSYSVPKLNSILLKTKARQF